jgi:hypothetical protein
LVVDYQPPVTPGYSSQPAAAWPPPQPEQPPRKSRTVPILVGAVGVLVVVVGVLAYYLIRTTHSSPAARPAAGTSAHIVPGAAFEAIKTQCGITAGYDIEDAGHTLIITVGGAYMTSTMMTCVFNSLNVPSAVREHIGTTRALDGQQTDTWDDYTARWTYHPDDGLQMTIREG